MIEYRKIKADERLHFSRLTSYVFSLAEDEEVVRARIERDKDRDYIYGAVDAGGNIVAGMIAHPYYMWFDGARLPMAGIGAVATVPEGRRQGHIRKVFENVFEDIYEKGTVFSHLYPFSFDYYRLFGYEYCGYGNRYNLYTEGLRKLKNNGTAFEFKKDDTVRNELIHVYETFAKRFNMMLSRLPDRWEQVFDIKYFGGNRLYYWKDAEGIVKSWVKLNLKDGKLSVNDYAWVDYEAMLGILHFIGMYEGHSEQFGINACPEFIPELLWGDIYDVKRAEQKYMFGMNRVVNAKLALEHMKKPDGEGKFTIKVVDRFAKWNNCTYKVEFGGGECRVDEYNGGADVEVSELALMQMVLGVYGFEYIMNREDVVVNGNLGMLEKVFVKKKMFIADHF